MNGTSATRAGTLTIPFGLGISSFAFITGQLITRFGKYIPYMRGGSVLLVVGALMIAFLNQQSPLWYQILSQLLTGIGVGNVFGGRAVAIQVSIPYSLLSCP